MLRSKIEEAEKDMAIILFQYIHVTVKGKGIGSQYSVSWVSIHPCYGQRLKGEKQCAAFTSFNTSMLRSKADRGH